MGPEYLTISFGTIMLAFEIVFDHLDWVTLAFEITFGLDNGVTFEIKLGLDN